MVEPLDDGGGREERLRRHLGIPVRNPGRAIPGVCDAFPFRQNDLPPIAHVSYLACSANFVSCLSRLCPKPVTMFWVLRGADFAGLEMTWRIPCGTQRLSDTQRLGGTQRLVS